MRERLEHNNSKLRFDFAAFGELVVLMAAAENQPQVAVAEIQQQAKAA